MHDDEAGRVRALAEILREFDLDAIRVRDGETEYELVQREPAPVVGVFYAASSPGADPFVTPGARVSVGQVVCILEAMKLMNEITSEYAGVVSRVVPENGQLVSLGDDLFWIEP
jgi:acetyl-CoA carboxylase biotin carboxyl carrier protein